MRTYLQLPGRRNTFTQLYRKLSLDCPTFAWDPGVLAYDEEKDKYLARRMFSRRLLRWVELPQAASKCELGARQDWFRSSTTLASGGYRIDFGCQRAILDVEFSNWG